MFFCSFCQVGVNDGAERPGVGGEKYDFRNEMWIRKMEAAYEQNEKNAQTNKASAI